ncbi:hypothetical protein [Beggiatoa leptomitoformis]|uniref:Outer membrane beta-barrel protein n=1 Tax=Beggiatoa leptomitoformis TaxID=288004 RepID=A0A2N9YGH2_9GAMM|nr:hypothetical protein [Beggiatoa leptomitoformis]ALG68130.2 hypothetical protein AL038_10950 [Beggiatoa leptomitoformis]AUI69573.2 hypothetical protein BLE401_13320 [Beggiatoa leptomitoformis]
MVIFRYSFLWLFLLNVPLVSMAETVSIVPTVFYSYRNFEYSVGGAGGVEGSINSVGLGVTAIYQQFYVDIAGEENPNASEEETNNLLFTNTVDFDRNDVALSLGYAINDSISTFIGYKYGKSTITARPNSPFAGEEISLTGYGAFIGAGGGWSVRNWGFISFSAAYAQLDSTYRDLTVDVVDGNARGTSLSIKWKAPLTENFFYDFSLIRHDYRYKDFEKIDSDISEQILSLRAGLSYRF